MIAFLMIAGLGVLALLSRLARADTDDHPAFVHRVHADGVPRAGIAPIPCWQTDPVRSCRAGGAVPGCFR